MKIPVLPQKFGSRWAMALLASLLFAAPVRAVQLSYYFSGVTAARTVLDFGSGLVNAAGVNFTISGTTTDIDLTGVGDGFGLFAATSKYDFGALGSFTSNVGGDRYFQDCFSPTGITCVGLFDPYQSAGFLLGFANISGNADSGMPIGTPRGAFLVGATGRYLINAAGEQMYMIAGSFTNMSIQAVPEPATLVLFGLGLVGLGWRRRRALI